MNYWDEAQNTCNSPEVATAMMEISSCTAANEALTPEMYAVNGGGSLANGYGRFALPGHRGPSRKRAAMKKAAKGRLQRRASSMQEPGVSEPQDKSSGAANVGETVGHKCPNATSPISRNGSEDLGNVSNDRFSELLLQAVSHIRQPTTRKHGASQGSMKSTYRKTESFASPPHSYGCETMTSRKQQLADALGLKTVTEVKGLCRKQGIRTTRVGTNGNRKAKAELIHDLLATGLDLHELMRGNAGSEVPFQYTQRTVAATTMAKKKRQRQALSSRMCGGRPPLCTPIERQTHTVFGSPRFDDPRFHDTTAAAVNSCFGEHHDERSDFHEFVKRQVALAPSPLMANAKTIIKAQLAGVTVKAKSASPQPPSSSESRFGGDAQLSLDSDSSAVASLATCSLPEDMGGSSRPTSSCFGAEDIIEYDAGSNSRRPTPATTTGEFAELPEALASLAEVACLAISYSSQRPAQAPPAPSPF